MKDKVAQFVKSMASRNTIAWGILLVAVFSFAPFMVVHAGLGETIANAIINVIAGVVDAVVAPIAALVKFIAGLAGEAMEVAINYFIDQPVNPGHPDTPSAIKEGWNFSRQLVNILFILVLVFIGLGTILRLQSYQLQRTLPTLLIIALLVNFSGVFVGLIVDAGSIITSAFLELATGADWSNLGSFSFAGNPAANLATHIAEILYYIFALLIYFIVILLFGVRTVLLWALAILAPLAFAAYILPATKKFWDQWLRQLIQWSIVGIPITFFLFLSKMVLAGANDFNDGAPGALASLAAPFTALILLAMGIFLSMQFAPAGASAVINKGKQWGIGMGKGLGSAAARRLPLGRFGENIRKRGQGLEVADAEKTRLERWGGRVLGKIPGMGRIGSAMNVPVLEKKRGLIQTRIDELEALKKKKHGKLSKQEAGELKQKKTDLENVNTQIGTASRGTVTRGMARFARRGATLFGGGVEMLGKELDTRTGAKDEREVAEGTRDVGNKDSFGVFNMVNEEMAKGPLANWNRIVGMLNGVRNRGDGDDIRDGLKSGQLNKKVIGGVIKNGRRVGPPGFRPLLKSFYGKIYDDARAYGFDADVDEQGNVIEGSGKDAAFLAAQKKSLPSKFNAQDFQGDTVDPDNFDPNTKEGKLFLEMILKERGADFMGQLGRRPRKEESRAIMEYIFKEGKHTKNGLGINWLLENDAEDVLRYLDSPGARSLGLGRGIKREEIERLIAQKQQGKTPDDLYEEQARLQEERGEQEESLARAPTPNQRKAARARVRQIDERIQQNEATLHLMDEDLTPTQRLVDDIIKLQNSAAQAAEAVEQDISNVQGRRDQARAERELIPLQQELSRRGVAIPSAKQRAYPNLITRQQQLAEETKQENTQLQAQLAPLETELGQLRSQEQQRQQEIQEAEQWLAEAENQTAETIGNYQQQLQQAQAELPNIHQRMTELMRQRQETQEQAYKRIQAIQSEVDQTTAAMRVSEAEIIPQVPAPLPKVEPNMPASLKRSIQRGEKMRKDVENRTEQMRKLLSNIQGAEGEARRISDELGTSLDRINKINDEEYAAGGTLSDELREERDALHDAMERNFEAQQGFRGEVVKDAQAAATIREAILKEQEDIEDIRESVQSKLGGPYQDYEKQKKDEAVEKRIKQRDKRRKKG